ncbi:MAG TPA: hypothetical protein VFD66_06815 [Verrucomicrobiae bacterium]|nr:hypothetical protein [Verrucomicrobiae bacterium]
MYQELAVENHSQLIWGIIIGQLPLMLAAAWKPVMRLWGRWLDSLGPNHSKTGRRKGDVWKPGVQ